MQVINAGQYNALDSESRNPVARVYVKRNYDSIPFQGKEISSAVNHTKFPKHILHSDGNFIIVYSKYDTDNSRYYAMFKTSDTGRTLWGDEVDLIDPYDSYNYMNPCLVELVNGDIGIIFSRDGTLYSCVVNKSGVIQTAVATMGITGNTPCLEKILHEGTTTYWLGYEASGTIYYRTCTGFSGWSGATDVNAITGLANNHYDPYFYYDTSNKFWLTFERVTDASATPEVTNVYSMNSDDRGSSWNGAVAQTSLVAGDGSAHTPSIIDTGTHRYFSYALEQQIQNYEYESSTYLHNGNFVFDEDNNRILFIAGVNVNDYRLVKFNRNNGTYTHEVLSDHYLTGGTVTGMEYDAVNNKIVIATTGNGLIVYDEDTTVWSNYTKDTTPALYNTHMYGIRVKDNKVYYITFGDDGYTHFGIFDLSGQVNTNLAGYIDTFSEGAVDKGQIFVSDNYIVFVIRPGNNGSGNREYPYVRVYNKGTLDLLHTSNLGKGTDYDSNHPSIISVRLAYDEVNDSLYTPAEYTAGSNDYGIAKYAINSSATAFDSYWTNSPSNAYGLLPNYDIGNSGTIQIVDMVYNNGNNRLYIIQHTLNNGVYSEVYITAFNTVSETYIDYFSHTDSDDFETNYPSIDGAVTKVMMNRNYLAGGEGYGLNSSSDYEIVFQTNYSGISEYRWHLLATEGETQRVYYRRTEDDSSWTAPAYLTSNRSDDYCNLGYASSRLIAFWQRLVGGIYTLRWDEDLSSQINISEWVESFEIEKTDEFNANSATLMVSDSVGLFDPLNYNSLYSDYFDENNIIVIQKGNNNNYNNSFYGFIGSGNSRYERGVQILYRLKVWDKSKNFFKKKVTTALYEDDTISQIAEDIASTYMGLAGDEYDLPEINQVIPTVQFIDEYLMDILFKLYQAHNYFPYFDESGVLRAKQYNYYASVDFTYYKDGEDTVAANKCPAMNITSFNFEWDDDELVNRVTVIGETSETEETAFPEEYVGMIQGAAGWFSKSQSWDFYFSGDKKLECIEPRLEVVDSCGNKFFGGGESMGFTPNTDYESGKNIYCTVTQKTSTMITALYILIAAALACSFLFGFGKGWITTFNPLAFVVAASITILGQIGNFYYIIHAKPVGEAVPETITATANDTDLQDTYGIIEQEIDNPFLDTYERCLTLANNELNKAKWFRYKPVIGILDNVAHQVGDVISAYNPHTNNTYKIFITGITQSYKRGESDTAEITGGLII